MYQDVKIFSKLNSFFSMLTKCELVNYLFSNSLVMRFVCARLEMRFTARSLD
jgi:hypothetical protein